MHVFYNGLSVSTSALQHLNTPSHMRQIDRYDNVPRQPGAAVTQAAHMQAPQQIRTLHAGKNGLGNAGKRVTIV
jgi:hypothetical protein